MERVIVHRGGRYILKGSRKTAHSRLRVLVERIVKTDPLREVGDHLFEISKRDPPVLYLIGIDVGDNRLGFEIIFDLCKLPYNYGNEITGKGLVHLPVPGLGLLVWIGPDALKLAVRDHPVFILDRDYHLACSPIVR